MECVLYFIKYKAFRILYGCHSIFYALVGNKIKRCIAVTLALQCYWLFLKKWRKKTEDFIHENKVVDD